jgi:hypothetical protein
MKKEFTVKIPDQLWVDSWENNRSITWTYEGPEKLYVLLSSQDEIITSYEEEIVRGESDPEKVVILYAEENPEIAFYLTSRGASHEYEYAEEINHDGTVWKYFTNPTIYDLFSIKHVTVEGFKLVPIIKKSETLLETKAKERKELVESYVKKYEFDQEVQLVIDKFLLDVDSYLKKMEKIFPWKYVEIIDMPAPKIPTKLIPIFDQLSKFEEQK